MSEITQSVTLTDLTFGEAMAFKAIAHELKLAKEKHPKWINGLPVQTLVVIEEAGEIAKAVVDYEMLGGNDRWHHISEEVAQTGAMCVRMWSNI